MKTNTHLFLLLLTLIIAQLSYAQKSSISGTVTDDKGVPLPGVNISITGTTVGTQTDFDGKYTLHAEPQEKLEFSFVGFRTQYKEVGSSHTLNIKMIEEASALEEIVITAFGRQQTRNETTANVISVDAERISRGNFVDATQALQGEVSGLTLSTPSGTPGSSPKIRIRGINSVTASNDPLYVLDGMPISSGNAVAGLNNGEQSSIDVFALINPNDIEEIAVLKDASAVAPYGADGANGVILITTKKGKKGKPRYNLSLTGGFQRTTKKGTLMANSEQLWEGVSEGLWNTYGSGAFGNQQITSRDQVLDWALDTGISGAITAWANNGFSDTDWRNLIQKQNAFTGGANFSISQGTENSNFYGSLGYNKTDGITLGTDFRRWSGYIKYNLNLSDKLKLSLSTTVANANQNGVTENGDTSTNFDNPFTTIYLEVPWANSKNKDGTWNIGEDWYVFGPKNNYPYMVRHNIRNTDLTRAIPKGSLEYKITDQLTFRTLLGLDYTIRYFKNYQNPINSNAVNQNGSVLENTTRNYHYTTQNSLDYNFNLGNAHHFDLLFLQEYSKYKTHMSEGYGENMADHSLKNLSSASANLRATNTFTDQISTRYVALLNYVLSKRYIANISYSYQGDSRFSKKFGHFYSVGLGWNLHREHFIEDLSFVNTLRLKLGYGLTGNAGIDRNQYQELMAFGRYDSNPSAILQTFGTNAGWEKSQRIDAALEYGLFNHRLKGSFGLFANKTYDMLFQVPLPLSAQFIEARAVQNIGEMKNIGFEMDISGDLISTTDFNWNVSGNFSTLNNYISSLAPDATIRGEDYIVEKGSRAREWYLVEFAGVDKESGLPLWYKDRTVNEETTSDFSQAKRNRTGKNALPKYSGSLGMRFDYKNLFLEGSFYFEGGHQVYDRWAQHTQSTNASNMVNRPTSAEAIKKAWRNPGDNGDNYYPRFDYGNKAIANLDKRTTRNLHNADNIRLRDIAIGYRLDKSHFIFLESLNVNDLTFTLRGTNLFTWLKSNRLDYDPSVGETGRILTTSPPVKSLVLNLNINF